MKIGVTVAVNGKTYEVEYSKKGDEYRIEVPDPAWIAPLPNPFHVTNTINKKIKEADSVTPETEELVMEVFRQILVYESQRGQA